MRSHAAVPSLIAFVVLTSCAGGGGGGEGTKVFGDAQSPCPATVLSNDDDDRRKVTEGADCFLAEFEAGRAVVWDVLTVTVEGDPIPIRYAFDGDVVAITIDSSRDSFGPGGGVGERRCDGVRRSDWLPEGTACRSSSGDGFRSDSLP